MSADPNTHPFKRMKGQTRQHELLKRRAAAAGARIGG
jgi:hypothetical protein